MITAKSIGLSFDGQFGDQGPLGTPYRITGHYSAGPKDKSTAHAVALCQQYDKYHAAKFDTDGIAYHYCITRTGVIIGLRPVRMKGTHVAMNNTGNIGILMHGTTGDKPSIRQRKGLQELLATAHLLETPKDHRSPVDLRKLPIKGHLRYGGTSCPGKFLRMYEARGAYR